MIVVKSYLVFGFSGCLPGLGLNKPVVVLLARSDHDCSSRVGEAACVVPWIRCPSSKIWPKN